MAGNFPDVPAHRLAWDRDGTIYLHVNLVNGVVGEWAQSTKLALNDEDTSSNVTWQSTGAGGSATFGIAMIFPELRDIDGWFVAGDFSSVTFTAVRWSVDTTSGFDGTWNSLGPWAPQANSKAAMRSAIQPVALTGVKAIRFDMTMGGGTGRLCRPTTHHIYGRPTKGDNLRLWHPTLDQEIGAAHLDWADTRRLSSDDRQFRVKNNSDTLTASSITVSTEALTDTTPSVPAQHLFSADGTNFGASVVIPSLAPGALTDPITLRRVTPSNAALSLWWARIAAVAGAWT